MDTNRTIVDRTDPVPDAVLAQEMIPIIQPMIGDEEHAAVLRPLRSGWITQGPEVTSFEREFAAKVGAAHAVAVSNCTAALHLALLAVGVGPGDEVITPSHSFIATANAIRYCGAVPVFVDICPTTFNLDPALLAQATGSRTRAILCVHQMGMPCDLAAILHFAKSHSIAVIEDAACAVGSEIFWDGVWEPIGRPRGDLACFSFHPRKLITTGDGGMITTNNPEWDRKLRLWRQHGMSVSDTVRHGSRDVIFESYPVLGFNYRMTDVQAAIGREQLKRLSSIVRRRRKLAARYSEAISAIIPDATPPTEPAWARSNWQGYCVRLPDSCEQKAVMQSMLDASISTRRGIMCAHRELAYAQPGGEPWLLHGDLFESERAQDRCILLPLFHQMTDAQQCRVVTALKSVCKLS